MPDPNILFRLEESANLTDAANSALRTQNGLYQNALLEQRQEANQKAMDRETAMFQLKDAATDAIKIKQLMSVSPERAMQAAAERIHRLKEEGRDASDSKNWMMTLQTGNTEQAMAELDSVIDAGERAGVIGGEGLDSRTPAGIQEFDYLLNLATGDPDSEAGKAARIKLKLLAGEGTNTVQERLGKDPEATEGVAESQSVIQGAKEKAKLEQQARFKPGIAEETARREAAVKAETAPLIEAETVRARETVQAEIEKRIKQEGQLGKIEDADRIYKVLSGADLGAIYGKGESLYPSLMRSQTGIDLMAQRDQLVGMLELAAAGEMKGQGQITESERKILKDSATALNNPDISPELARIYLDQAMKVLYRNAGKQFRAPGLDVMTDAELMDF